jgi:hypothetical protein
MRIAVLAVILLAGCAAAVALSRRPAASHRQRRPSFATPEGELFYRLMRQP